MKFMRLAASLAVCGNAVLAFLFSLRGTGTLFAASPGRSDQAFAIEHMPPKEVALIVLLYPLMGVAGVVTAVLLGWGGVRGLCAVRDPGRWRARQRTALNGMVFGALVSLIALSLAPPVPVTGAESALLPPAPTSGYLTLTVLGGVGMVNLLALLLDLCDGPPGAPLPEGCGETSGEEDLEDGPGREAARPVEDRMISAVGGACRRGR